MGEAVALARRAREGDGDEDDGQGDAVVEAALDVEALADPDRDQRVAHQRLPERGVRGREDRPRENRLPGRTALDIGKPNKEAGLPLFEHDEGTEP